jgi:hypothetical protein
VRSSLPPAPTPGASRVPWSTSSIPASTTGACSQLMPAWSMRRAGRLGRPTRALRRRTC